MKSEAKNDPGRPVRHRRKNGIFWDVRFGDTCGTRWAEAILEDSKTGLTYQCLVGSLLDADVQVVEKKQ